MNTVEKTTAKPVVVPTVRSMATALWALTLVAAFAAAVWLYLAAGALRRSRALLAEDVATSVATPFYTAVLPAGWRVFSVDGAETCVFRDRGSELPVLHLHAERDEAYAYHALDVNPALVLSLVGEDILEARIEGVPDDLAPKTVGSARFTVKPGVEAVLVVFDAGPLDGVCSVFYCGDVRYMLWALWGDGDAAAQRSMKLFFHRLFEDFDVGDRRESIDRPVVDSAELTAEVNDRVEEQVARETALWRLFAARAETESEAALVPAIRHYREALRLLSSIRQERVALATEDFRLYRHLLDERRKDVDEWFVILDKAVSMRDWEKARAQAQWIVSHATLTGERADARRAADILARDIPPEE